MVVNPPRMSTSESNETPRAVGTLAFPRRVRIVEVGPRDGLQNEVVQVPTYVKVAMVHDLVRAGLRTVEVTAFVSHKRVPQLADAAHVMTKLSSPEPCSSPSSSDSDVANDIGNGNTNGNGNGNSNSNTTFIACVPNIRGLKDALRCGTKEIAILVAATDDFSLRNIGCNIEDSLTRYKQLIAHARENNVKVRAYISCAFGCPYTGNVPGSTW